MKKRLLHENWILSGGRLDQPISAAVPGCVHTDLRAHGIIGDPFWRDDNRGYQWIENENWIYSCTFDADPTGDVSLVFEGLDTYAEITLNGTVLGKTENMFIPHCFSVSGLLRSVGNELTVRFLSPIRAVEGLPLCKGAFTTERMRTRRLQCTYGWDWTDRFVTCGIYRPVYLSYANGIDVESVYVYTEHLDDFGAQIHAEVNFSHYEQGAPAHVEILAPDGTCVAGTEFYADRATMIRRFDLPDPQLWFPNGYGEQPLYRLVVTVGENRLEQTFGVRTLRILQLPDEEGSEYRARAMAAKETEAGQKYTRGNASSGFQVIVNGKKIFCQGGNWVPCDPFPSEESDEKITCLVKMAKEMGANFLRVWGGGLFEKPAFYDACDREGILVAQDFLMACGNYPEKEEWFIEHLTRESEYAAKYLRNHPCLAWWHGDNENAMRGSDTQEDYTGRDSALTGIAPQIYRLDPARPFLPSSPYGGEWYASITCGTAHTSNYVARMLDYFHTSDCTDYQTYFEQFVGRFVSEEVSFGAANRPSLLKFMTEDDLLRDEDEAMWLYHTKGNAALPREIFHDVRSFARKLLGTPTDGEDRFFQYKYLQYEWMRQAFENVREALGYCNGEVFWMFNDCWPAAAGWAIVDYYCLPKAAYYCFKRCAAPLVGVLKPKGAHTCLAVSNRGTAATTFEATARLLSLKDGSLLATHSLCGEAGAYGVSRYDLPWAETEGTLIVCDLTYDGGQNRCFHKKGTLPLIPCDDRLTVVVRTDTSVTLRADSYVHAVELEGQFIFDDNYFSLLAGETKTVAFRPWNNPDRTDFTVKGYTLA